MGRWPDDRILSVNAGHLDISSHNVQLFRKHNTKFEKPNNGQQHVGVHTPSNQLATAQSHLVYWNFSVVHQHLPTLFCGCFLLPCVLNHPGDESLSQ